MSDLNHIFIMGNMTKDVEYVGIPGGKTGKEIVAKSIEGRIASNRTYTRSSDGKKAEDPTFIDFKFKWPVDHPNCKRMPTLYKLLKKGFRVLLDGRLALEHWKGTGENEGKTFQRLEILVNDIKLLTPRERTEGAGVVNLGAEEDVAIKKGADALAPAKTGVEEPEAQPVIQGKTESEDFVELDVEEILPPG
jgi:single-stranded DNA-binding protein